MKLCMSLAAFTGLGYVTASLTPRDLTAGPVQAHLKPRAFLMWDPPNAYETQEMRREFWEDKCSRVLESAGCPVGIIHQGHRKLKTGPNGEKTSYVHVEGTTFMDTAGPATRKMRVFEDGSFKENWSRRDRKNIVEAKRVRKKPLPQDQGRQKALLFWDPADAYISSQPTRRRYWEKRCEEALIKNGCLVGKIHMGQATARTPDGVKTAYVNMEGAPSLDMMSQSKKLRVLHDGSTEDFTETGWSEKDLKSILEAKRPKKTPQPQGAQKSFLAWSPIDAYKNQRPRRVFWEHKCGEAIIRAGCGSGTIHKGEIKVIKKGAKTSYINLEGVPLMEEEGTKKMRVFQNGWSEDVTAEGWSARERSKMQEAKRPRRPSKSQEKLMDPMIASTSPQAFTPEEFQDTSNRKRKRPMEESGHTQEGTQHNSEQRRKVFDPADPAYKRFPFLITP